MIKSIQFVEPTESALFFIGDELVNAVEFSEPTEHSDGSEVVRIDFEEPAIE